MTALKFNKVNTLPTSGYNEGDVYFVKSEKKIYVRTATGWEDYGGSASGGSDVASKLEVHNYNNSDPIIYVSDYDDNDLLVIDNGSGDTYSGLNMILTKYNEGGGSFDYYDNSICGKGLILRRVKNGVIEDSTSINPYGIFIMGKKF